MSAYSGSKSNTTAEGQYAAFSKSYLTYAILLLAVINVNNYMDRMLLSVLLPLIKEDLQLSDTQLGLVTGFAFAIFYASFGLPLARFADVWVRKYIISGALVFWSAMTVASGAAQNFVHLLLARIGVGAGEAGCIPPSHSLISDYFPVEKRSSALAIHTAGASIGMIAGLALGGLVSGAVGWRWTFVILGAPGILLGLLALFTLREPPRGMSDGAVSDKGAPDIKATLSHLFKSKSYPHLLGFFGFGTLASFGFNQWLPSFYSRSFGMSQEEIGVFFGITLGLGSAVGTLLGGYWGDRLMKKDVRLGAVLGIGATLAAFPFWIGISLSTTAAMSLSFNFVSAALSSLPNGAAFAMIQAVAPSRMRALAAALAMFTASMIGIGGGPFLTGLLSDFFAATRGTESLRYSLFVMSFFTLWPIVHLFFIRRTIREDIVAANVSVDPVVEKA